MRVKLQPGTYIVAVSGGVDSVVLLDVLAGQPGLELIVAHVDHGIRSNSVEDAQFVESLALQYDLPFVTERIELGANASEATARKVRYEFLQRVQAERQAKAIVTAHHQDDVIETAIHNLIRGTGRRGLASLRSTKQINRPLLNVPKADIKAYALQQKLSWREDTTNYDERYTRNYIRHRLLVRFDATARQRLLALIERQEAVNGEIDELIDSLLLQQSKAIDRHWFATLPHDLAKECLASWLRAHKLADFDHNDIERLAIHAKTKQVGKRLDVMRGAQVIIKRDHLALIATER